MYPKTYIAAGLISPLLLLLSCEKPAAPIVHRRVVTRPVIILDNAVSTFDRAQNAFRSGEYEMAATYLEPFARKGNATAASELGQLYYAGNGVSKDDAVAAKWFRVAADRGDPEASTQLGYLYAQGTGV